MVLIMVDDRAGEGEGGEISALPRSCPSKECLVHRGGLTSALVQAATSPSRPRGGIRSRQSSGLRRGLRGDPCSRSRRGRGTQVGRLERGRALARSQAARGGRGGGGRRRGGRSRGGNGVDEGACFNRGGGSTRARSRGRDAAAHGEYHHREAGYRACGISSCCPRSRLRSDSRREWRNSVRH